MQVLDAFSSGVEAFKQMKNQYGFNENNIDDTMTEIQEVCITTIWINTYHFKLSGCFCLFTRLDEKHY